MSMYFNNITGYKKGAVNQLPGLPLLFYFYFSINKHVQVLFVL